MKKTTRKLTLRTETVRLLEDRALASVVGGLGTKPTSYICKPPPASQVDTCACPVLG